MTIGSASQRSTLRCCICFANRAAESSRRDPRLSEHSADGNSENSNSAALENYTRAVKPFIGSLHIYA